MREYVHEKLAVRRQPPGDVLQQPLVITHMLEHLDRHHPVKRRSIRHPQLGHVRGDDLDVIETAPGRGRIDIFFLAR